MAPYIEQDHILLLGMVFHIQNIILLGSIIKTHYADGFVISQLCFAHHVLLLILLLPFVLLEDLSWY